MRPLLPLALLVALVMAWPAAVEARAGESERRQAALGHELRTRRLSHVAFEGLELRQVLQWLRVATGFNLVIKPVPLAQADIDVDEIVIDLELDDVTIAQVLDLVLEPHGLAWQVKGNVVYVTTYADALGRPVTRLFAISHITYTKTDFIAPDINLHPSDFTPVEEHEPERPVEDDPLTSGDAVAELVQELVFPGQWDEQGWTIRATDRYLVVRAPLVVQREVEKALALIASIK
jgi:hypothetical protein